ncbi:hypothetical protein BV22DRAFT_1118417 [Leucogyrophana mollusca]|uniref:Uncharacterized protein n=1 Tax=Leucogyrophana mollusca TaxID=85980 RepID=A0ACB8BMS1_9AGAM|nr:hypothetical protein BV22DRAFT_1118417 [Leucogyrophana mollusca]
MARRPRHSKVVGRDQPPLGDSDASTSTENQRGTNPEHLIDRSSVRNGSKAQQEPIRPSHQDMTSVPLSETSLRGNPSISTRESIAWLPDPPFEDSSVVVLSSRSTSTPSALPSLLYLDLRLSLPLSTDSTVTWGFAGLRQTLQLEPLPRHRWYHIIDTTCDGMSDEGQVELVKDPKTGEDIEVETGIGRNPSTGAMQEYQEIWSEEPIPQGSNYTFLTSTADPETSKAFMAVLGSHALALSHEEGLPFQAIRMHRSSPDAAWMLVYKSSHSPSEPSAHSLEACLSALLSSPNRDIIKRGDRVELGGRTWTAFDAGIYH